MSDRVGKCMNDKQPSEDLIFSLAKTNWAEELQLGACADLRWQSLERSGKNQVWRVTLLANNASAIDVVVRVLNNHVTADAMREEIVNHRHAAQLGLAPKVIEACHGLGLVISDFVDGQQLHAKDMDDPIIAHSVVMALKTLHSAPVEFEFRHRYLHHVRRRAAKVVAGGGIEKIPGFQPMTLKAEQVIKLLEANPVPLCPCHSDIVTHNIMRTSKRQIQFVDWEVSGMGDPHEELANLIWSASLNALQTKRCIDSYFGKVGRLGMVRVALFLMLIPYDWVLRKEIKIALLKKDDCEIGELRQMQTKRLKEAEVMQNSVEFKSALQYLGATGNGW